MFASDGLAEGCAQGAVDVVDGAGGGARAEHFAVELFDVLGFELVDPVGSGPGYQVSVDVGAVADQRFIAH